MRCKANTHFLRHGGHTCLAKVPHKRSYFLDQPKNKNKKKDQKGPKEPKDSK